MRLTLRTLLAWMDDTLQPDQVREIGGQVAESPFARELKERIQRVTRQRRLAVPSSSGPDATDPNVVAAYLDNDLDPDDVAEFEKRCLTSDVNLAEVASVHQILSLLGQKVKVPDAARVRMYQLVKGRESSVPRRRPTAKRPEKEPVTRPIQPWVLPEVPRRPWIERYGPALACLLLIVVSTWAARESLRPRPSDAASSTTLSGIPAPATPTLPSPEIAAGPPATKATPSVPTPPAAGPDLAAAEAVPPHPTAVPEAVEPPDRAKPEATKKSETPPTPSVPAGVAALAEKPEGILLRYNDDRRQWDRLEEQTPLKTSDRILCLEPFRASIDVGKVRILLVHQAEIRIVSKASDEVPAIQLMQGKILVREPGAGKLRVLFAGRTVDVGMGSDSEFGMERVSLNQYGEPVTQPASLGVLCQRGEVTIAAGAKPETLKPMNVALVDAAGEIQTGQRPSLPTWLNSAEPTAIESQIRDDFAKLFHPGRPVLAEVVSALEDERKEIRPLAVAALEALGDLSLLLPTLSRPEDPIARRSAIRAIRSYMSEGPDASDRVRAALDREFGNDLGGFAHHMLIGFSPEEASKPELYIRLVGLLAADQGSIGLRELALETLKTLTGRDDLGYDPDKPEGKGFQAWAELLQKNQLRAPAAPAPPPQPGRANGTAKRKGAR